MPNLVNRNPVSNNFDYELVGVYFDRLIFFVYPIKYFHPIATNLNYLQFHIFILYLENILIITLNAHDFLLTVI